MASGFHGWQVTNKLLQKCSHASGFKLFLRKNFRLEWHMSVNGKEIIQQLKLHTENEQMRAFSMIFVWNFKPWQNASTYFVFNISARFTLMMQRYESSKMLVRVTLMSTLFGTFSYNRSTPAFFLQCTVQIHTEQKAQNECPSFHFLSFRAEQYQPG